MIDLKETKRVKDNLLSSPDKFLDIIEGTSLAICITNKDAKFVAVNENYAKLYGYSKEELIGNNFTLVVPQEHRDALKKYHDKFFVDKYEILRKWVVQNKKGEKLVIFADAGYNDKIEGGPMKITLIQFMKKLEGANESHANAQLKG